MQGASVKQTRSVCSERARAPAGGICEANTRILRANFRLKTDAMFIESQPAMRRINGSPKPRRIELCAGRERKENASVMQSEMRFPDDSPGGKRVPESALRLGRSFRMAHQAETASRNRRSNWDAVSAEVLSGNRVPL